ncbi:GYD domain-containing protein [Hyphococcus flavus]|uniref:GYD domain-containing protein n=1 Tax=Hyphococcus flavus TaxID=1866326 RepID=A0AAE9ZD28_9PROT|nr:GYD domain-containing protein [Hyphococcus flavus]WDI32679.1 GYD domain-containing protein [Hyphococcus flavus]
MKYVIIGKIGPRWGDDPARRVDQVHKKLDALKVKLETVYYTQGAYDFMEVVEAEPEAMLALSLWYKTKGYGELTSMPAFSMEEVTNALTT